MRDDVPLPGAGVLRLVDQHVIDAAVELEMHPAGGDAVQHFQRLVDQVVVIEQAAFLLFAAIVGGHGGRDDEKSLRAVADRQGAALFDQRADANAFIVEQPRDVRSGIADLFRHQRFARRQRFGQEYAEIGIDLLSA